MAVALVWGFWVVADSAQFSTVVTEVADQRFVGTALTLQLALGFALTIVTVQLTPMAAGAFGWPPVLMAMALGPAFGVAAMMRLKSLG